MDTSEYILNHLNIKSLTIISYSYSAHIALLLEQKIDGVNGLIFISPFFKEKFNRYEKFILRLIKKIWPYPTHNKKTKFDYSKLKNYENPTLLDARHTVQSINTKDLVGSLYAMADFEGMPNLEVLKIPVMIICGKKDKILSSKIKNLFAFNKKIQIITLENKHHLFLKTEVAKVTQSLKNFLTMNMRGIAIKPNK